MPFVLSKIKIYAGIEKVPRTDSFLRASAYLLFHKGHESSFSIIIYILFIPVH